MLQPAPLNRTIPITAFNRGKAGQIFSDVKKSGMTVVIKNNEAECVLLAPDEYRFLLERLEDAELLSLANARMQNFKMEDTIPFDTVCKESGLSLSEHEDTDEVDFE